jgi:hypothetical protein
MTFKNVKEEQHLYKNLVKLELKLILLNLEILRNLFNKILSIIELLDTIDVEFIKQSNAYNGF